VTVQNLRRLINGEHGRYVGVLSFESWQQ
jgi:hypothetical protein